MQRHGLTRAWFHQLNSDPARSEVLHAALENDILFVVTSDAKLHALNSETGEVLWERRIGDRDQVSYAPAANSRMVGVINGFQATVLDRRDGTILWQARLPGTPGAGCEMSEFYIYAPLMNGRLVAYCLEDQLARSEEDAVSLIAQSPKSPTDEDTPEKPTEPEDESLAKIVKAFEEAKALVLPPPEEPQREERIVLGTGSSLPLVCQAFGHSWLQPTLCTQSLVYTAPKYLREGQRIKSVDDLLLSAHTEMISWATDRGMVFFAAVENFSKEDMPMRYQISVSPQTYSLDDSETVRIDWGEVDTIVARPTYALSVPPVPRRGVEPERPGYLVVGTRAGYIFPINDQTSEIPWQFSANGPVVQRVAVIEDNIYACTERGGMHALDLETGKELWYAPRLMQFVAASKKNIFALDRLSNLVVIDRETGVRRSSFSARQFKLAYFNVETDRVYLLTKTGLVQCLHEQRLCPDPNCQRPLSATGMDECVHVREASQPIRFRLSCFALREEMKRIGLPRQHEEGAEAEKADGGMVEDDKPLPSNEKEDKDEKVEDEEEEEEDDDPFGF